MFDHLLVPTDFGESADRALEAALAIAEKFDARVTLLHAYVVPAAVYGDGPYWPSEDLERRARVALDAALVRTRARHPRAEAQLAYGEAWAQIVEAARAGGADLIVMGAHGRRGLASALLGSVTVRVVRASHVPVLAVSAEPARRASAAE